MGPDEYVAALRRDAAALLTAARAADPTATIAACPDFAPIDLVWHIGKVHRFWCTIVAERLAEPPADWPPPRPDSDAEVIAFAEESASLLPAALAAADPADAVWTWSSQHDVAFVQRRMAQETAVHRVDAERAAGGDHRIDAHLAADGIDEFLTWFLSYPPGATPSPPLQGSVHVHCTDMPSDVGSEWTITPEPDGALAVTRDHTKADTAMRGPAHDLLMVLWRRDGLDSVEVFGDRQLAEQFVGRSHRG